MALKTDSKIFRRNVGREQNGDSPHFAFPILFLWTLFFVSPVSAQPPAPVSDEALAQKIKEVREFYEAKQGSLEQDIQELFGVNFSELMKKHREMMQELNHKMSFVQKIPEAQAREAEMAKLRGQYGDLQEAMEIYYYFQNELEKDHPFMGEYLGRLEEILGLVIEKEPLFRFMFRSQEFKNQHGLVLVRAVWPSDQNKDISGETLPLNVHAVFADKSKTPLLVKLTPLAFKSLPFLRSILIHELNHVYFFKNPKFADVQQFQGAALEAAQGQFSHYFSKMNPLNPSYQFYLIHEYYSFKTQFVYEELVPEDPYYRLDQANKEYFQKMLDWTYSQLNRRNREFVKKNPDPPIAPLLKDFYRTS